jgi:large subunit ribosomal protein L3
VGAPAAAGAPKAEAGEQGADGGPGAGKKKKGNGTGKKSGEASRLLGGVLKVTAFKGIGHVDIRGVTKGRGFAGVIRRYHFNAGPKSHGSKNIREPGSTGMHTDPGRVLKGKRMPGHMGAVQRKMRNLMVVGIEEEDNLLLVRGSVPGPNGGYVYIEQSLVE